MADNETIADIIAEKRRQADKIERNYAEMMKRGKMISDCYVRELVADIRREADRLESAWKRERAKIEADALEVGGIVEAAHRRELSKNASDFGQLGDAAKLREALGESRRIASGLCGCRLNDYWKLNEIVRVCEVALAATEKEGGDK